MVPYIQNHNILPKGPYLPCVSMAGRVLLAGYHVICTKFTKLQYLYVCIFSINFLHPLIQFVIPLFCMPRFRMMCPSPCRGADHSAYVGIFSVYISTFLCLNQSSIPLFYWSVVWSFLLFVRLYKSPYRFPSLSRYGLLTIHEIAYLDISCLLYLSPFLDALRPRQNGRLLADDIFKCNEICECRLIFHWSLFLSVKLTIFQHWFR